MLQVKQEGESAATEGVVVDELGLGEYCVTWSNGQKPALVGKHVLRVWIPFLVLVLAWAHSGMLLIMFDH